MTLIRARNDSQQFLDYFKKFVDNIFLPYIDENKIDTVIHLGDIVDRRKYINYVTLRHLKDNLIQPLLKRQIDLHVIIAIMMYHIRTQMISTLCRTI